MANPQGTSPTEQANRELVEAFRAVTGQLWQELVSLIGESSAVSMWQSALQESRRHFPFLSGIDVEAVGVRVDRLRANVMSLDRSTLRAGLLAFMNSLEAIMVDLTGDVLMRKVGPLVQQLKRQLDEE
jgi:hypothetical protein